MKSTLASPRAKPAKKAVPKSRAKAAASSRRKRSKKSETNHAIATELAPAVAIALLDKTDQDPDAAPPALDALAAGVAPSDNDGKVRVQLLFENGSVLPVEMSHAAGAALSSGLSKELKKSE
jgi:hypothetical protein